MKESDQKEPEADIFIFFGPLQMLLLLCAYVHINVTFLNVSTLRDVFRLNGHKTLKAGAKYLFNMTLSMINQ